MGSVTTAQPGYCWLLFPGKQWHDRCRVSLAGCSPGHHVAWRLAPLITYQDLAVRGAVTPWGCDVAGVECQCVGARRKSSVPQQAQF